MTARLPERHSSRALLIGASKFSYPGLFDLPAVINNVQALSGLLTDPKFGGFDEAGCRVLTDPATQQVGDAIHAVADEALDTLVLYYAGHGVLSQRGDLFLAVDDTNPDPRRVRYSGVPLDWFRSALAESPARNRVLILDCCFSGRAAEAMSDAASIVRGTLDIRGTYTLASAPAYEAAVAPIGARFTAFSGELLTALRQGIPGAGPLLTLGDIYPTLTRALLASGLPRPQHLGTGLADHIALTCNPAYRPATLPAVKSRPVAEPRRSTATVGGRAANEQDPKVAAEFHAAMLDGYRRAKKELNYNAAYFLQMVQQIGGLEAARRLIRASSVSSGFTTLWEKGRLDLAVEAVVLQDRFTGLFTEEELDIARNRLAEYGYSPAQTS
ncbi:caspase family protein [Micromonospora zingiberis]|uniref:Caspase family protein n=1 Tax=Micromonospora zingiberis TaxID=2053011 RepID=A0A4V2LXJ0_9ACTN|nr:caspase family protein [Micromonospora zingiberis]TCC00586.1 caspase family protein [Micromonospora zingiberis]